MSFLIYMNLILGIVILPGCSDGNFLGGSENKESKSKSKNESELDAKKTLDTNVDDDYCLTLIQPKWDGKKDSADGPVSDPPSYYSVEKNNQCTKEMKLLGLAKLSCKDINLLLAVKSYENGPPKKEKLSSVCLFRAFMNSKGKAVCDFVADKSGIGGLCVSK